MAISRHRSRCTDKGTICTWKRRGSWDAVSTSDSFGYSPIPPSAAQNPSGSAPSCTVETVRPVTPPCSSNIYSASERVRAKTKRTNKSTRELRATLCAWSSVCLGGGGGKKQAKKSFFVHSVRRTVHCMYDYHSQPTPGQVGRCVGPKPQRT